MNYIENFKIEKSVSNDINEICLIKNNPEIINNDFLKKINEWQKENIFISLLKKNIENTKIFIYDFLLNFFKKNTIISYFLIFLILYLLYRFITHNFINKYKNIDYEEYNGIIN